MIKGNFFTTIGTYWKLVLLLLFLSLLFLFLFLGLAFAGLNTPPVVMLWYRVDHPGLKRTGTAPEGLCHPRG
jgi:hypothetical protein